ncbi:MAG: zinc-dependent metalloprotease [Bacteroidetes bacterium]|nr:zinc-dependent metalloprotease [Bacteroidota bacterium]
MQHRNCKNKILVTVLLFSALSVMVTTKSYAQIKLGFGSASAEKEDTTQPKPVPRTSIKPYASVITKEFTTQKGLFTVHKNKDKIYFEIPDSLLKMDIMVINRLSQGPGGYGIFAGEELDERTIQFDKGADSTIKIRYQLIINEADSTNAIYKAVIKAAVNPIAAAFPILAYGDKSTVIDVSRFLKEKNFINGVDQSTGLAKNTTISSMKDINIESIHVYPINVEIQISKTVTSKLQGLPEGTTATFVTNTSFIALPKVPMQRRIYDPRVGFFVDQSNMFRDNQQKAEIEQFALRWRLEPKPEDMAKWKSGELVEPAKQIVYYIDPATPKQWRPYLIAGINDWQKAFEKAGFKNAIVGKEWPENDTTMQLDDARYSMINYLPSTVANAYGPNIHDPRSGEIIQTHIGWYHNVMQLLQNWYMVQAAAVDTAARKAVFSTELMGQLIRFVSSHEVGHTLGLRHNFGSSSRTPVDSLRSKHYLDEHGHTASIMDYARFNYVAQPEDNIPQYDLFPRIGEYAKWAIEWGYKYINAPTVKDDKTIMRKLTTERTSKNPRLWFGDGETRKFDPQCQTEDLGDNAAKASAYGIKNLQRILPNLPKWTYEENGLNTNLTQMYRQIQGQYSRYIMHVYRNIAGTYYTIKSEEQPGAQFEPTPIEKQRDAMAFLNNELFKTPFWLLDKTITDRVVLPENPTFIEDLQVKTLNSLLDAKMINNLLISMNQFGDKAYSVDEFLNTLHKGIWQDLNAGSIQMDSYRRNLQKSYVGALIDIMTSQDAANTETDAASIIKAEALRVAAEIDAAIPKAKKPLDIYHLKDLQDRIKKAMKFKLDL